MTSKTSRIPLRFAAFAALCTVASGTGTAFAVGGRTSDHTSETVVIPAIPRLRALSAMSLRRLTPAGWFGVGLSCKDCNISRDDSTGEPHWRFRFAPEIYSVDPDSPAAKAGLARGDVLTQIDGTSITSPEGGRRFGAVRPGDKVTWTYKRDGRAQTAAMIAEEHPDRDDFDPLVGEKLRAAITKLNGERDRMRAESGRLGSDRSLEAAERDLEATLRELERSEDSMRRRSEGLPRFWPAPFVVELPDAPDAPESPDATERSRHLRYQGAIGGSSVEVRGSGSVVVTEERGGDAVLITTPDATIRIEKNR